MLYLYSLLYELSFRLACLVKFFIPRVKAFVEQRQSLPAALTTFSQTGHDKLFWFHCASLGEFEQIRPLLERTRQEFPTTKLVVTFFSSSGYEIHKSTPLADVVCYLPLDRKKDLNAFLDLIRPTALFLVKYEFWPNLIYCTKQKNIALYSISSSFRKKQLFFKSFSFGTPQLLKSIDHFFVLNRESKELLHQLEINAVTVVGDTRFDQVLETLSDKKTHPILDDFLLNEKAFIAGSTWKEDHEIILKCCREDSRIKWIIAPHKIDALSIKSLEKQLKIPFAKWTSYHSPEDRNKKVLILDCIGVLSSAYAYARFAYIGGAMGKGGLHNTLEAAVFRLPIVVGKNYKRYPEARDLIDNGGMKSVSNPKEFELIWSKLTDHDQQCEAMGTTNFTYVWQGKGGTDKIISFLKKLF